jgi:hypothetical protein
MEGMAREGSEVRLGRLVVEDDWSARSARDRSMAAQMVLLRSIMVMCCAALMVVKLASAEWWLSGWSWIGLLGEGGIAAALVRRRVVLGSAIAVVFFAVSCLVHLLEQGGVLPALTCGCLGRNRQGHGLELLVAGFLGLVALRLNRLGKRRAEVSQQVCTA